MKLAFATSVALSIFFAGALTSFQANATPVPRYTTTRKHADLLRRGPNHHRFRRRDAASPLEQKQLQNQKNLLQKQIDAQAKLEEHLKSLRWGQTGEYGKTEGPLPWAFLNDLLHGGGDDYEECDDDDEEIEHKVASSPPSLFQDKPQPQLEKQTPVRNDYKAPLSRQPARKPESNDHHDAPKPKEQGGDHHHETPKSPYDSGNQKPKEENHKPQKTHEDRKVELVSTPRLHESQYRTNMTKDDAKPKFDNDKHIETVYSNKTHGYGVDKPKQSDQLDDHHDDDMGENARHQQAHSMPSVVESMVGQTHTGLGTFYSPDTGACGGYDSEKDRIVAISSDVFEKFNPADGNPNHNKLCGLKIKIEYKGKTTFATAMDECPTCSATSLDLSPAVFNELENPDVGVLHSMKWSIVQ